MSANFKYKIEHDFGLAPNPFHGYCTLAVCKSSIRQNKNLETGSWIFGTGCKKVSGMKGYFQKLIFCMKVEEKLTFNEYWIDSRFQCKKPVINGSLVKMYGDNIYHQESNGKWIQENSAHSINDNTPNIKHLKKDIDGKYILISKNFYYFGKRAIQIPTEFKELICTYGRNWAFTNSNELIENFIVWLQNNYQKGIIYDDPISWDLHLKK